MPKLYNATWVVTGLALFVGIFIGFSLYGVAAGASIKAPEPAKAPGGETQCIEDTLWMRENHMQLLVEWREDVVRNNDRVYRSQLLKKDFDKSLTNTCLDCHENKQDFCDSCHTYSAVSPNCWDCHNIPKEQH